MRYLLIILLLTTPLFAETLQTESAIKKHLKEKGFYSGKQRQRVYLEKVNDEWVVSNKPHRIAE